MTLRDPGYQSKTFEPSCIKRSELLKSFEQGSDTVRAGHWEAESSSGVNWRVRTGQPGTLQNCWHIFSACAKENFSTSYIHDPPVNIKYICQRFHSTH